VKMGQIGYKL